MKKQMKILKSRKNRTVKAKKVKNKIRDVIVRC